MTDTQTLPKEKKKRIRKPKPAATETLLNQAIDLSLPELVAHIKGCTAEIDKRVEAMNEGLKLVEGL